MFFNSNQNTDRRRPESVCSCDTGNDDEIFEYLVRKYTNTQINQKLKTARTSYHVFPMAMSFADRRRSQLRLFVKVWVKLKIRVELHFLLLDIVFATQILALFHAQRQQRPTSPIRCGATILHRRATSRHESQHRYPEPGAARSASKLPSQTEQPLETIPLSVLRRV